MRSIETLYIPISHQQLETTDARLMRSAVFSAQPCDISPTGVLVSLLCVFNQDLWPMRAVPMGAIPRSQTTELSPAFVTVSE